MTTTERQQVFRNVTPTVKMIEFLEDVSINGGRARAEWYLPSTLNEAIDELWVEQYTSEISGRELVRITDRGFIKLKEYFNA